MPEAKRAPPFRAEQLGSLLRPKALVDLRYRVAEGKASDAELRKVTDEAVKAIVATQQECGFHGIGDGASRPLDCQLIRRGEFRRHMFWGVSLASIEPADGQRYWETLNGMEELQTAACVAVRSGPD